MKALKSSFNDKSKDFYQIPEKLYQYFKHKSKEENLGREIANKIIKSISSDKENVTDKDKKE
jgi:hypothetical protein